MVKEILPWYIWAYDNLAFSEISFHMINFNQSKII